MCNIKGKPRACVCKGCMKEQSTVSAVSGNEGAGVDEGITKCLFQFC